jgi:hypothetical protein
MPHPVRESSPGGSYGTVPLRRTTESGCSRSGLGLRDGIRSSVGGALQASGDLSVRSFVSSCSGEEISISSYAHLSLRERSRCGSAESVEIDNSLSAGHHLPVGHVRKRLGQQRTEDDDVKGRDVWTDGAVLSSAVQDLLKVVVHFGPESDGVLVEGYGTAMQGKHEVGALIDCLVDKGTEALDRCAIAVGGPVSCVQYELEGSVRKRGEQGIAGWVTPVERADTDPGIRGDGGEWHPGTLPPHRRSGGREHAVAVGRCVATQFTALGALAVSCPLGFAHPPDVGSS